LFILDAPRNASANLAVATNADGGRTGAEKSGQEAADLGGDEFAGGAGWDQAFEHA
jgi:hypothetical protein